MLAQRRAWAAEEGLAPDFVEDLYQSIVSHFVAREMERLQEDPA